jgi:hypothetical protein
VAIFQRPAGHGIMIRNWGEGYCQWEADDYYADGLKGDFYSEYKNPPGQ